VQCASVLRHVWCNLKSSPCIDQCSTQLKVDDDMMQTERSENIPASKVKLNPDLTVTLSYALWLNCLLLRSALACAFLAVRTVKSGVEDVGEGILSSYRRIISQIICAILMYIGPFDILLSE